MRTVTVLFARKNSIYFTLPHCEVYDATRNALTWPGGTQVVCHPPCGQWGRLAHFARPNPWEKALAPFAVGTVQRWGGVLEHPAGSRLWQVCDLPAPGRLDSHGGFTLVIDQLWFGHRATKRTWLYVCAIDQADVPVIPFTLAYPTHSVATRQHAPKALPELSRAGRESTPSALAVWLVNLARKAAPHAQAPQIPRQESQPRRA